MIEGKVKCNLAGIISVVLTIAIELVQPAGAKEGSIFENNAGLITFEAERPAFHVIDETAYINPRGFSSLLTDFEGKGFGETVICFSALKNLYLEFVPAFSTNGNTSYLYGLKLGLREEDAAFPAIAFALRGGSSRTTEFVFDPMEKKDIESGTEDRSEMNYRLILSRAIGGDQHINLGYHVFNGSSKDADDNVQSWDSSAVFLGYDRGLGRFRSIIETWYDPSEHTNKSAICLRGPLDWIFQFQLGYETMIDYDSKWSENAFMAGIYIP